MHSLVCVCVCAYHCVNMLISTEHPSPPARTGWKAYQSQTASLVPSQLCPTRNMESRIGWEGRMRQERVEEKRREGRKGSEKRKEGGGEDGARGVEERGEEGKKRV